jgi:hypothetical protein
MRVSTNTGRAFMSINDEIKKTKENELEEMEIDTVTLTLDDDSTIECEVVTIFDAGGKSYIALLPLDEDGENKEREVYLYRFVEKDGEEPDLENIEDDDEYERVADAFDEWLDELEFEESEES